MEADLREILENEWYVVRHSGETPEIALHSAFYFLTRAKDGPQLTLSDEQRQWLLAAAVERFGEIIVRDLAHDNSGTSGYRGPRRSIVNFARFLTFCQRQDVDPGPTRAKVAAALRAFLLRELAEVASGRTTLINCNYQQLAAFADELHLTSEEMPAAIANLCPTGE